MIRGITVVLHEKVLTGEDAIGAPTYKPTPINIENVLVAPVTSEAEAEQLNLDGKHAVYELGIPKGDTHEWEDTIVEFFGEKWHTIGFVTQGIDSLVPTQWNKKVKVERHE